MVKREHAMVARPLDPGGLPRGRDVVAERVLALGFLTAFGVWMVLALALGTT